MSPHSDQTCQLTWPGTNLAYSCSALSLMPFPCSPGCLSTNLYPSLSSPSNFQTRLQYTLKFSFTQKLTRPSQFFINYLLNFYTTCSHLVFIYIHPRGVCVSYKQRLHCVCVCVYVRLHHPPNLEQWFTYSPYSTCMYKLFPRQ